MLLFSSFPSLVSGKGEGDGLSGDGGGQAIFVSTHLQLSTTTQKTIKKHIQLQTKTQKTMNNNNNKKHTIGGRTSNICKHTPSTINNSTENYTQ